MNKALIARYNVPGPRYTSYPTVPYWDDESFSLERWIATVRRSFAESNESEGISLYVHMPYCEHLCTFCGCNKRITKQHAVEKPYIDNLLREWALHLALVPDRPGVKEIHLGGGTPTFFSPENLAWLIRSLLAEVDLKSAFEFGFEANPNYTTVDHLTTLYELGFTRLSLGIQDFDPKVQAAINRIQPLEIVAATTETARSIGYRSINFDLVYGLPFQRRESVIDTVEKVLSLRPERIAFYSYAHVPWIKGVGQRKFSEADLPRDAEKRALYETGRTLLEEGGYHEIGMDHFALKSDALYQAAANNTLHRNFMGYTPVHTRLSIGLGVSSISDSWYGFAQNEKTVEGYSARLAEGSIPIFRGHILDEEDLMLRRHVLNVMCRFETSWASEPNQYPSFADALARLERLQEDGLVSMTSNHLRVTDEGKPFIRNICMALDARLWRHEPETRLFSQVI